VPSAVLCLLSLCASAILYICRYVLCCLVRLPFRDVPFSMCTFEWERCDTLSSSYSGNLP
jgi:hypothetical protein